MTIWSLPCVKGGGIFVKKMTEGLSCYELRLSYPNNPPVGYAASPLGRNGAYIRSTKIITRSSRFNRHSKKRANAGGAFARFVESHTSGIPYYEKNIILIEKS